MSIWMHVHKAYDMNSWYEFKFKYDFMTVTMKNIVKLYDFV